MTYEQLLRVLPRIAREVYPEETHAQKGIQSVFSQFFEPMYKQIVKMAFFQEARKHLNQKVQEPEYDAIASNWESLKRLYEGIFPHEIVSVGSFRKETGAVTSPSGLPGFNFSEQVANSHVRDMMSFERFFMFNRLFGLIPQYVEKGIASSFWREIQSQTLSKVISTLVGLQFIQSMSPSEDMGSNFCFSRFLLYLLCLARTNARFSSRDPRQNPLAHLLGYILPQAEAVLEQIGMQKDNKWMFDTNDRASSFRAASGRDPSLGGDSREAFPAPMTISSNQNQTGYRPTRTQESQAPAAMRPVGQPQGLGRESLHSNLTFSPTKYQTEGTYEPGRTSSAGDIPVGALVHNQFQERNLHGDHPPPPKVNDRELTPPREQGPRYPVTSSLHKQPVQLGGVQHGTTSTGYVVKTPDKSSDPLFLDGSPNTLFITDSSQDPNPRAGHPSSAVLAAPEAGIPASNTVFQPMSAEIGMATPPRGSSGSLASREWLSKKREEYSRQLTSQFPTLAQPARTQEGLSDLSPMTAKQQLLNSPQLVKMGTDCKRAIHDRLPDLKRIFIAYSCYGEADPCMKMSSANFHRLLKEWGIVRSDISYMDLHYAGAVPAINYLDYLEKCCQSPPGHKHTMGSKAARLTGYLDYKDAELIFLEFSKIDIKGNLDQCLKRGHSKLGSNQKSSRASTPDKPSSRLAQAPPFLETITERIVEARLNFDDFINALQRIAELTQAGETESRALAKLLDGLIWKLKDTDLVRTGFQDLGYVSKLKDILLDPKKVKLLSILYRNIQTYYLLYTNNRLQMDFKSFYSFFKDFGICPNMISSTLLQKYFAALASLEVDFRLNRKWKKQWPNTPTSCDRTGREGSPSTPTSSWKGSP